MECSTRNSNDLTLLLRRIERGEEGAADEFMRAVYDELHKLAAAKMEREPSGLTLQATALIHEAWLRLGGCEQPNWQNRAHFFCAASEAMRRILIDSARRRRAARHGGGSERGGSEELAEVPTPAQDERVLALNEALEQLSRHDPRKAELVKLRYFAGVTLEEAAKILEISLPTATRWWAFARAWLHRQMRS